MNGAAAIHDFELAALGGTSEDVDAGLADGSFGMVEETGAEMNAAILAASARAGAWGKGWLRRWRNAPISPEPEPPSWWPATAPACR